MLEKLTQGRFQLLLVCPLYIRITIVKFHRSQESASKPVEKSAIAKKLLLILVAKGLL